LTWLRYSSRRRSPADTKVLFGQFQVCPAGEIEQHRGRRYIDVLDRLPFQATQAGTAYESIGRLPVSILLDNVRSLYNVGSFFRTADAAGVDKLLLAGITGHPPKRALTKTALGAEERVHWEHSWDPLRFIEDLRRQESEIAAIETSVHAIDLFDWKPRFPVCVVFGHEVDGIRPEIAQQCDSHIRIPMLGSKHSLNVATAGGVVIYELLRKYRELVPDIFHRSSK
jgi:tRNA G18 (ribose-2'-O)-methylase SpoU